MKNHYLYRKHCNKKSHLNGWLIYVTPTEFKSHSDGTGSATNQLLRMHPHLLQHLFSCRLNISYPTIPLINTSTKCMILLKHIDNINFSLDGDESSGTRKFFALTGPILDVIENGYTLVVDELDSKLHPNLVCKIVSLFNSKDLNPKKCSTCI